jgi:hypothetical protein
LCGRIKKLWTTGLSLTNFDINTAHNVFKIGFGGHNQNILGLDTNCFDHGVMHVSGVVNTAIQICHMLETIYSFLQFRFELFNELFDRLILLVSSFYFEISHRCVNFHASFRHRNRSNLRIL